MPNLTEPENPTILKMAEDIRQWTQTLQRRIGSVNDALASQPDSDQVPSGNSTDLHSTLQAALGNLSSMEIEVSRLERIIGVVPLVPPQIEAAVAKGLGTYTGQSATSVLGKVPNGSMGSSRF